MKFFKPLFKISKGAAQGLSWLFWLFRFAVLAGVIFAVVAVGAYSFRGGKPPAVDEAPYSVVAVLEDGNAPPLVHNYYASLVLDKGSQYVMVDWWTFDGKGYNLEKGEKSLTKKDWSRIGIYRR